MAFGQSFDGSGIHGRPRGRRSQWGTRGNVPLVSVRFDGGVGDPVEVIEHLVGDGAGLVAGLGPAPEGETGLDTGLCFAPEGNHGFRHGSGRPDGKQGSRHGCECPTRGQS